MKEAKFEVESRLDKYNFDTKLTNRLLDSLVVQKGKSGLGFTRVAPPLNHNYSCIPNSCDNALFDVATPLTVNPPIFENCNSAFNDCNDIASTSESVNVLHNSSDNLIVNDCVNSDNVCKIETVDISHEMPSTIIKNENILTKNHIQSIEPKFSNYKDSRNQKIKMVHFHSKGKSVENKSLYKSKSEAKNELNRFVSGGSSVQESAKFSNTDCFSHKRFHNKPFNDKEFK